MPASALSFANAVIARAKPCTDDLWTPYVRDVSARQGPRLTSGDLQRAASTYGASLASSASYDLPLVTQRGDVHWHAGLNWGQRGGRNPDQAYIPVPAAVARSGFFPPRSIRFLVRTDDGKQFVCSVAQDGDKAIHTPDDNSLLGRYFRKRLGVPSGEAVTLAHLAAYGRRTVTMCRLGAEEYLLDFGQ